MKGKRGVLLMGRMSYRPKRGQAKAEEKRRNALEKQREKEPDFQETMNEEIVEPVTEKLSIDNCTQAQEKIQSTKIIGELGNDYHIYIEDYVYTYIYQLAASDYTKESAAALIGQSYGETKEILIKGLIPINMERLQKDSEWIDPGVMEEVEVQRKSYFKDQQIIGWMHMQPGYGTMMTMKELKAHQDVFEGDGTVCMLVDAINKIEALFVYEEDELKEQTGYCMYYERNEDMQQFMLDHPFNAAIKEEMKDNVVNQFREIGKMRKAEYMQRKNLNLTVMAASIILIALTAVIVKMNGDKGHEVTTIPDDTIVQASAPVFEEQAELPEMVTGEEDVPGTEPVLEEETQQDGEKPDSIAEQDENEDLTETETQNEVEQQDEVDYDTYIVEAGDTLADICYKQYGSAERSAEVAKFNNLDNTDHLYVGEELKMPK